MKPRLFNVFLKTKLTAMKRTSSAHFITGSLCQLKNICLQTQHAGILVFFLLFSFTQVFAQAKISGTVVDSKGNGIPSITVSEKGGSTSTITEANGSYSITVRNSNGTLVFSSVGFNSQEVAIEGRSAINIVLEESVSKLNEVVVVGYGSQSRRKLTTAVAKLDPHVLENLIYTNVGSALQGNITGLQVQSNGGGQPGVAPRIILRGGTSINNPNGADPLYIVDGVIRPNGTNDINSSAIESVQVLKDAASTAIYGARSSNGVVIITTKSGKPNKTRISYNFNGGMAKPLRLLEYVNAHDYIYYNRLGIQAAGFYRPELLSRLTQASASGTGNNLTNSTAFTTMYLAPDNQHKLNEGWQSMPDPIDPGKTIIYKETNYQDLIYRDAFTNDHYIDVAGGSDRALFYAGLGYIASQGTATITDYKRLSFNMNGSYKVKDNLNITGRLQYSNRTNKTVANLANLFYRSASLPGTAKYRFEDGTMAPGQNSSIGNPDYYFKGPYAPRGNTEFETITLSLGAKWNILKNLFFEPLLSINRDDNPIYSFQPAALINGVGTLNTSRVATSSLARNTQYQADGVLTYGQTFGSKNNFEAKAGFSHYYRRNTSLSGTGQNAVTDLIPTLNASGTFTALSSNISPLVIQSVFSRINYDYDGKYLLSLNVRYDGASNLGENQKFGFFPGLSVGWNMDRETFFQNIIPRNLMQLKLRASYGITGNISDLGDFQADGSYTTTGLYGGASAIRAGNIPNQDLRWEQSKTLDIGVDMGLFNNRISVIFDYYDRRTDDLLTTVSLPASSGFPSIFTNNGSLQNKGVEIELNFDVLPAKSDLKWTASFNASHTTRKILELPYNGIPKNRQGGFFVYDPSIGDYTYLGGLQEGGRMGDMFAYKQLGIYSTDAEAAKALPDMIQTTAVKTKFGGDVQWADIDENGLIDSKDRVYVGNPYPVWTGGFNNYFRYKNFGLNIRTDYTTGNTIYNYPAIIANSQAQGDALPLQNYIDGMWKKQGDNAKYPRYTWQDQSVNIFRGAFNSSNSVYYEKGDFLAIREVSLSYTLPESLVRKANFSNVRLSLSGSNLHYFTGFSGLNPEDGGMDNGHYPISRTFAFGLNVTF
jgi:TonB-linked SusC/RagA family outer membrane protein